MFLNCSEHFITCFNNFLTLIFVFKEFHRQFQKFFLSQFSFHHLFIHFISFYFIFFLIFILFYFILFYFILFYFILFYLFLLLLDSSGSSSGVPGAIPLGTITAELGPGFTIHSVCAFEKNDVLEVCHLIQFYSSL